MNNFKTVVPAKCKAKDPYRYPNVSEKIENQSKGYFKKESSKMILDITKQLTKILKER